MIRLHDAKTGKLVALPKLPAGDITSVTISRSEKRLAFYVNGDRSPSNLYVYTLGEAAPRRLTDAPQPGDRPRRPRRSGGRALQVLRRHGDPEHPAEAAPGHRASAKAPALVWVHGGPGGQTRKGYSALIQYLVNHGYVVLGINNRGSSGYGKTFFTADDQKHGREPLWDCVEAKNVPGVPALRGRGPDRHHRRQLRRLHGARRAGLPARRLRASASTSSASRTGCARSRASRPGGKPSAWRSTRRSATPWRRRRCCARSRPSSTPTRSAKPLHRAAGRQRPARHQARVRRHRRRGEEERRARRVRRLPRRGPRLHEARQPDQGLRSHPARSSTST